MTDAAPDIDDASAADTQRPPRPEPKPFNPPLPGLWVFLACLLIALLCNSGGLRGHGFIGTEQSLVRDNDLLNRLPGLQMIWFRANDPATYPLTQYAPLAQTMFFFEHMLWGDTIWAYRLTSVLLHAGVGLMIWLLVRRLSIVGGVAAALLFVAHPMTVNNVSWIAERRNPLAGLLALASTYLLLRAAGVITANVGKRKLLPDDPMRLYALGVILFVLALFSNAIVATLPLVVLLIAWWKRPGEARADVRLTGVCAGLLIAGVAMLALSSSIEKSRAGVSSPAAWNRASTDAGELAVRTQIAGRAVAFYVQKLVVPFPVSIDYPRWQTPRDVEQFRTFSIDPKRAETRTADVAPNNVVAYLFPLAVIVVLAASWTLRGRLGRGQFVAIAGFVLLLAPSLGFIDLGWMRYTFVADRAVYLASVSFIVGVVWLAGALLAKAEDRTVTISSAGIVIGLFAILSLMVSLRFREPWYFWVSNARAFVTSRTWMPRYELAATLLTDATDPSGLRLAKQAIGEVRLYRPDEPSAIVMTGLLKERDGDELGALGDFENCMQTFPTYAPAYLESGDCFRAQADQHPTDPKPRLTALRLYSEAAANDPFDARARVRLGETSWEVARRLDPNEPSLPQYLDQAATAFDEAVQLKPYNVDLLVQVSRTLIAMGKLSDAGALLESAHTIAPFRADVYVVIADASLARTQPDVVGADGALRAAIELDPHAIGARLRLGKIRITQERWREAREQYKAILDFAPDNAEAKQRLAEIDTAATTRPGT